MNRSIILQEAPRRILIRMPNWLGDLVMATPIITDLHHHWPEAKISVICQGSLSTVIQAHPNIDSIINFQRPSGIFHPQASREIVQPLKNGDFDLGILTTNSLSSAYWFWRGGVRNRLGFATHCRSALLSHPIPFPEERTKQHLVTTYKMLLEPLGIPISDTSPRLYVTDEEKRAARLTLQELGVSPSDQLIGVNPGAAYGSAKCWLPDRFKLLTHKLLDHPNLKVVYFGDKAGASLVDEICRELPSDRVINLAGKTNLRELIAYIQACHLFLTNDSGPMHVASALGVPLVALFGSTSDTATGPYQGGKVIHKHVPCSPCYRRECPIDFRCMTRIGVEEVYETIRSVNH